MTRITIRMDTGKAMRFLNMLRTGTLREKSLKAAKGSLQRWLLLKVLTTNLDDVFSIDSAAEMRRLMLAGGTPRKGTYHPAYKRWKTNQPGAAAYPHILTGKMTDSINIDIIGDILLFYIPSTATERTSMTQYTDKFGNVRTGINWFNFGPIHEARKSILKSTVVFAWKDIMAKIGNIYRHGALSA